MESSLELVWKIIPEEIERKASEYEGGLELLNRWAFVYTIVASLILAVGAGASVRYLGFPGDLPNVIECVHELGYVPMEQTLSMIMVSLCSIAAGGSLGPEAPLVAVSASVSGWISMHIFKHEMPMVRKCTIIGMSAGLSAFFGVQLGGECIARYSRVSEIPFLSLNIQIRFHNYRERTLIINRSSYIRPQGREKSRE